MGMCNYFRLIREKMNNELVEATYTDWTRIPGFSCTKVCEYGSMFQTRLSLKLSRKRPFSLRPFSFPPQKTKPLFSLWSSPMKPLEAFIILNKPGSLYIYSRIGPVYQCFPIQKYASTGLCFRPVYH